MDPHVPRLQSRNDDTRTALGKSQVESHPRSHCDGRTDADETRRSNRRPRTLGRTQSFLPSGLDVSGTHKKYDFEMNESNPISNLFRGWNSMEHKDLILKSTEIAARDLKIAEERGKRRAELYLLEKFCKKKSDGSVGVLAFNAEFLRKNKKSKLRNTDSFMTKAQIRLYLNYRTKKLRVMSQGSTSKKLDIALQYIDSVDVTFEEGVGYVVILKASLLRSKKSALSYLKKMKKKIASNSHNNNQKNKKNMNLAENNQVDSQINLVSYQMSSNQNNPKKTGNRRYSQPQILINNPIEDSAIQPTQEFSDLPLPNNQTDDDGPSNIQTVSSTMNLSPGSQLHPDNVKLLKKFIANNLHTIDSPRIQNNKSQTANDPVVNRHSSVLSVASSGDISNPKVPSTSLCSGGDESHSGNHPSASNDDLWNDTNNQNNNTGNVEISTDKKLDYGDNLKLRSLDRFSKNEIIDSTLWEARGGSLVGIPSLSEEDKRIALDFRSTVLVEKVVYGELALLTVEEALAIRDDILHLVDSVGHSSVDWILDSGGCCGCWGSKDKIEGSDDNMEWVSMATLKHEE